MRKAHSSRYVDGSAPCERAARSATRPTFKNRIHAFDSCGVVAKRVRYQHMVLRVYMWLTAAGSAMTAAATFSASDLASLVLETAHRASVATMARATDAQISFKSGGCLE